MMNAAGMLSPQANLPIVNQLKSLPQTNTISKLALLLVEMMVSAKIGALPKLAKIWMNTVQV